MSLLWKNPSLLKNGYLCSELWVCTTIQVGGGGLKVVETKLYWTLLSENAQIKVPIEQTDEVERG